MSERTRNLVFILMVLLLSSWHLDQSNNANIISRAATVAAVVEQGTFQIDRFEHLTGDKALVNGHYYSEKAPLPALIVVPFHWILHNTGLIATSAPDHINLDLLRLGGLICGSVPFALIALLCWRRLRQGETHVEPSLLVLLTFFGSFLFVYSGSFYGHLPGALFLLLAFIALREEHYLATGAWAGCAVLCEYTMVIFPLCWIIGLFWNSIRERSGHWRPVLRIIFGGLPFALGLLLYDQLLFGSAFDLGYDHVVGYRPENGSVSSAVQWEALWGLSFSPYRGLFPHMPLLLLAVIAALIDAGRAHFRHPTHIMIPVVVTFLFISSVGMWWGGWAFGPRHLTGTAVLLAYTTLPYLAGQRWSRVAVLIVGPIGICYVFAAKFTLWYAFPSGIADPLRTLIIPAIERGNWTRMEWPVLLGLAPGPSSLFFVIIFATILFVLARWDARSSSADAPVPLP